MLIKLLQDTPKFKEGQIISYPQAYAEILIEKGIAELVSSEASDTSTIKK